MAGGHCVWVSIQVSHSVVTDSLRPHGLQHTRPPGPSPPTPRACSNSCPSSRWCHPTISSSVVPFSSCLQSLSPSGSFPMSQFFTSGGQSIDSSFGKESACNAGDCGLIPGSGRSAGEGIDYPLQYSWASLVAQLVKNLPAMPETWIWSLGWEDPLEKGIPTPVFWPRESHGLYRPWGSQRVYEVNTF